MTIHTSTFWSTFKPHGLFLWGFETTVSKVRLTHFCWLPWRRTWAWGRLAHKACCCQDRISYFLKPRPHCACFLGHSLEWKMTPETAPSGALSLKFYPEVTGKTHKYLAYHTLSTLPLKGSLKCAVYLPIICFIEFRSFGPPGKPGYHIQPGTEYGKEIGAPQFLLLTHLQ